MKSSCCHCMSMLISRHMRSEHSATILAATACQALVNCQRYLSSNGNNHSEGNVPSSSTAAAATTTATTTISASIFKNPIVHELWTARQKAKRELQAKHDNVLSSNQQQQQPTMQRNTDDSKSPNDSYVEVSYPFSTDALLWETYRNPWGQMRLGKLFEDLDALAGNIAFFHVHSLSNNNVGGSSTCTSTTGSTISEHDYPIIVTASVDRIRLRHRPQAGSDQKLSGQVTWTGTSSMEIRMQCCTCTDSQQQKEWLEAYVTFVTLDPHTKKPMRIPTLRPETEDEQTEFNSGAARAKARKLRRKIHTHSSSQTSSTDDDSNSRIDAIAKQLMIEAGPVLTMPSLADPHVLLLKDTVMQNAMIAQPQSSNLHNRVFGGFLIRRAFELAYSNAYLFGGARPIFLEVDEISFASPVDVGDLLVFYSRILFTENNAGPLSDYYQQDGVVTTNESDTDATVALMHVEVEAWVTEPEKVSARMSNQFYFTFAVVTGNKHMNNEDTNTGSSKVRPRIRKVLPSNIDEARRMATRMHLEQQQKQQFGIQPKSNEIIKDNL